MNSSSKNCENSNKKVVVVKCTNIFPLKNTMSRKQKEKLEELKRNLSQSNVSYISRINKQSNAESVNSPGCSKWSSGIQTKADHAEEVTKRKQIKNLPVGEATDNTITIADDDVKTEEVIDLINKEHGDFLETQIPFFSKTTRKTTEPLRIEIPQENGIAHDFSKLPANIYQYRVKEEHFLEDQDNAQMSNENIENAKKFLESIMITDSPVQKYELFTPEQLKKLPDDIFQSSPQSEVKEEISSRKEENEEIDSRFQNMKIRNETNSYSGTLFEDATARESSSFSNSATEIAFKETNGKKIKDCDKVNRICRKNWEVTSKHVNFDTFVDTSNLNGNNNENSCIEQYPKDAAEVDENTKVNMCDEDVVILKEMDKFIQELKVENETIVCVDGKEKFVVKSKQQKDFQGCEGIEESKHTNKSDSLKPEESKYSDTIQNVLEANVVKKDSNEDIKEVEIRERATVPDEDKKKSDILQLLVHKIDIDNDKKYIAKGSSSGSFFKKKLLKSHVANIAQVNILNENEVEVSSTVIQEALTPANTEMGIKKGNSIVNDESNISKVEVKEASSNSITPNGNEDITCSMLILKDDGTLERVPLNGNIDRVFDHALFNQNKTKDCSNNEESKIVSRRLGKEEILVSLEKVKTVQGKLNETIGDATNLGKEQLRKFCGDLKDHIKCFKELYEKLEMIAASAEKELEGDLGEKDVSASRSDLVFVKDIVEKCLIKEDMKPKYKVIRISKKNENETKLKNRNKPKDNLLQTTLYRINKLLDVFERNQKLVINAKRKGVINKFKEIAEKDVKDKKTSQKAEIRCDKKSSTNFDSSEDKNSDGLNDAEILEKNKASPPKSKPKNSNNIPGIHKSSLTVILDRSDYRISTDARSVDRQDEEDIPRLEPLKSFSSEHFENYVREMFTSSPPTLIKETNDRDEIDDDCKENKFITECKKEMNSDVNEENSPRYFLRPRNSGSECNYPTRSYRDELICKKEKCPGYEINYLNVVPQKKNGHRRFDYVLRNDKKPCVVLYHKKQERDATILDNVHTPTRKRNLARYFKDGDGKCNHAHYRYETRSKTLARNKYSGNRVLRNRSII